MALTDQPYLPLYVDDWMNNTKLKMCSPGAHGLMISIMCLMHKSDTYGVILLKQKFKQSEKQTLNFASQIAKLTSFDLLEIEKNFNELIAEKVLEIEDDFLICKRMVKDADVSKKRASSGKNGGKATQKTIKNFAKAKVQANSGNGIESENDNEISNKNEKEPHEKIFEKFNEVCTGLPSIQKLTPTRITAINQRINEYGLEKVLEVIDMVAESRFMNGENRNGWKSDFDWIFKASNFLKIIEGNYVNKNVKTESLSNFTINK